MNRLIDFETAITDQLKLHFGTRAAIEAYPEQPENYLLAHAKAAILVRYQASSFQEAGPTVYRRSQQFGIHIVTRELRGHDGAYQLIDEIESLFFNWHPVRFNDQLISASGSAFPVRDTLISRRTDGWEYSVTIEIKSVPFPIQG